jgi:hypothetical protein
MSEHQEAVVQARELIKGLTRDPVVKLLLANSHLTLAQLETILADRLFRENEVRKSRRRLYRPSGRNLSRGAFNRSLIQAQNNIIRSIYTVLLLGYSGLFDTASLQPFLELSDTVQGYVQENRQAGISDRLIVRELNTRLLDAVSSLASRKSFKDIL